MRILVDADACPVKSIIVKLAKKYNIQVIMICDTSHIINDNYSEVIVVDKSRDSVDIALVNKLLKGDIVVTQDYGVATMSLARGASALNQDGRLYTSDNIDMLLFERHISQKIRRSGGKSSSISKRTSTDDSKFEFALNQMISDKGLISK